MTYFVFCDVWRMGSMADVTTPEKTMEANEGLDQAVPVVEGSVPGMAVVNDSMPDPKCQRRGKEISLMRLTLKFWNHREKDPFLFGGTL